MTDYPDFTYKGDIDIIAQTIGNLAVDITAQTLTALGINITAQDLAELIIKIHAQDVGVYIEKEWAPTQDKDQTGTGSASGADTDEVTAIDYEVGATKVLYVDDVTLSARLIGPSPGGGAIILRAYIDAVKKLEVEEGGESTSGYVYVTYRHVFTTPLKLIAGEHLYLKGLLVVQNGGTVYANYNGRLYDA